MPNVEIVLLSGENVECQGVGGASLSPFKHRLLAKAAIRLPFQYVYLAREGGFLLVRVKRTIKDSGIFSKRLEAAFTMRVDTR